MNKLNFNKILCLILSGCLLTASLMSCSKKEQPNYSETFIADFEKTSEIQIFEYLGTSNIGRFGKAIINGDKQYIKSGTGSLKVEVLGDPTVGMGYIPSMKIPLKNNIASLTSFKKVIELKISIFNPMDKDCTISYSISSKNENNVNSETNTNNITIKKQEWKDVSIKINRAELEQTLDIGSIRTINFYFRNRKTNEEAPTILYFDSLKAVQSPFAYKPLLYSKAKGEIMFFEVPAEISKIVTSKKADNLIGEPFLELNGDLNYVTQGMGSLKVTVKGTPGGSSANSWPGFILSGKALEGITNWKGTIPKGSKDVSEYKKVKYDIYNNSDRTLAGAFTFFDGTNYAQTTFSIQKKNWLFGETLLNSVPLQFKDNKFKFDNIKEVKIWTYGFSDSKTDAVYYVDNVRLE